MRYVLTAGVAMLFLAGGFAVWQLVGLFAAPSMSYSATLVNRTGTEIRVLVFRRDVDPIATEEFRRDSELRVPLFQGDSMEEFKDVEFVFIAVASDLSIVAMIKTSGAELMKENRLVLRPKDVN